MSFRLLLLYIFAVSLACSQTSAPPTVRFETNLGNIDVILQPASAPRTVANFLNYVTRGAFNNSVIHRSVPGFIIQGGGYTWQSPNLIAIPSDPPVRNEFAISNTRGTIAMAKLGSDPNSATNQWFFNLADNSANLNGQNGGFTVFGRIADDAGLAVMDKIAAVPVPNPGPLSSPWDQIPLIDYRSGAVQQGNLVIVSAVTQTGGASFSPVIADDGIVTASTFGGYAAAAPGSFVEIYGTGFSSGTRSWSGTDFRSGRAPTSLDGVNVTVNGQSAYVSFISPSQVNVQIPSNVPAGGSVPVIVANQGQASAPVMLAIRNSAAGLFAPASFKVNGKQFAGALHSTGGAFVTDGTIPGITGQPASPGETILFFGIGFGGVTPNTIPVAGQVVQGLTALTSPVEFKFGGTVAAVTYAGLVPGSVGLYQFNVVVPPAMAAGDTPVTISLRGEAVQQTMFLSVGGPSK